MSHTHGHGHGHSHGHGHEPVRTRPPATGAAAAPGVGPVIGWVNGRPVPRAPLDRRLRELRDGPMSAALPVPGSAEDRQLARWLTQVILTEVLCEEEARALGLAPVERPPLDRLAAVELGSINAAALNGSPWVRALYEHVTADAEVPPAWRVPAASRGGERFLVRHRLFASPPGEVDEDDLEDLGAVALDTLPAALAGQVRRGPYGRLVGPVRDALGWHVAVARPAPEADHPGGEEAGLVEAARRRRFARWLDRLRAERVDLVPGLEHPGDPRQPDNHHKH
ncbi:DUF7158 domain-containing protein [Thermoactinospora rubra]|uniref:DUF7158 domain-containing protein n=1 Tax=Thermoactinospora rubra TaxID=1088767 RepID=UPI001F0B51E2|nr:hypothetical protein [Thermoactinospora rubra]